MLTLLARLLSPLLGLLAVLALPVSLLLEGGGTDDDSDDSDADDSDSDDSDSDDDSDDDDSDDKDDGPDLAAQLEDERRKRKAAERRARAAQRKAKKEPGDDDPAEKARVEANARANRRIARAEVKAAAGGRFADPNDAADFLAADLDDFVDDDGDVDEQSIADALDDLAERKPYLLAAEKRRKPRPDRSQGARSTGKADGLDAGRELARKRYPKSA